MTANHIKFDAHHILVPATNASPAGASGGSPGWSEAEPWVAVAEGAHPSTLKPNPNSDWKRAATTQGDRSRLRQSQGSAALHPGLPPDAPSGLARRRGKPRAYSFRRPARRVPGLPRWAAVGRPCATALVLLMTLVFVACAGPSPSDQRSETAQAWQEPEALPVVEAEPLEVLALPEPEPLPAELPRELVTGVPLGTDEMAQQVEAARDTDALAAALAERVDEPRVIAATLARNPNIRAARARVRAAAAEHGQLDAVQRLLAQYETFAQQLDPHVAMRLPRWLGPNVFPLPGVQGLRSRVIALSVEIAAAEYEATLRETLERVRVAFAELVFRDVEYEVLAELREFVRSVRDVAQTRFRAGRVDYGALAAAEARLATLENRLEASQRAKREAAAVIRDVLNVPEETVLGAPEAEAPPALTEEQFTQWLKQRDEAPRLQALQAQTARTEAMIQMVELMSRPSADQDLSELPDPLADEPRFREQPAVPMDAPYFGRDEAYRDELAHRAAALRDAHDAARNRLRSNAEAAWLAYEQAQADAALARDTLAELAEREVEATLAAFRAGRVDIEQVLGAVERKLEATLGHAAATRRAAEALYALDRTLGAVP